MLHIPSHPLLKKGKSYAQLADTYLSQSSYAPIISTEQQQAFLRQLDTQIPKEQFYTLTEVKNGQIMYSKGVGKWLGYADKNYTDARFKDSICNAHKAVKGLYARALFEKLIDSKTSISFATPVLSASIALKHCNGQYLYCKQICYPFQINSHQRITEYLSEFIIVKEFDNEKYNARWLQDVNNSADMNEGFKKLVWKKFEEVSSFSVQELRIIKRYASPRSHTSEEIAKSFKIQKGTVNTFNKRILEKGELFFGFRFENARAAAVHLKKSGMLP